MRSFGVHPDFSLGTMSYFATISGVDLNTLHIAGVSFTPANQTQDYVRRLAGELGDLDGLPVYLVDDGVTGTSHEIIGEAIEVAYSNGDLLGTRVGAVLQLCEKTGGVFRVWDAGAIDAQWPSQTHRCGTLADALGQLLSDPIQWEIRFASTGARTHDSSDSNGHGA